MDHDELVRLSGLARGGDIEARNAIVEANLGLVYTVVGQCFRRDRGLREPSMGRHDAFQEGVRGLIRAAELWDPARGVRFTTYAMPAVRGFIFEAMARSHMVAAATTPAKRATRWKRMADGGMPEAEIVAALGLGPGDAACVRDALAIRSLTALAPDVCLGDVVCGSPGPPEEVAAAEEQGRLVAAFNALDDTDRGLMVRRHGLGRKARQDEGLTARWLGCSVVEMRRRAAEVEGRLAAAVG